MRHHGNRFGRPGIFITEVVIGTSILAVISALAITAVISYCRVRDQYLWRQTAAWAAAGQLQRYQAGAPLDSRPPEGLIPEKVRLLTQADPGQGDWKGFNRVTVTATVDLPNAPPIHERVIGYVPARAGS
ncbi:MAG TPA: hypothetical protein VLM89_11640 [Phycisphaerae bacterium]|nr:hypothetical protein [Phycisphaerae bacterium]